MRLFLFVVFIVTTCVHAYSQRRDEYIMWPYGSNNKITFAETISPRRATTDSLYGVVKNFIQTKFTSEKDTIWYNDEKRTIRLKGAYFIPVEELGERGKGYVSFTMNILCYYKAIRYTITDFEHNPLNPNCVTGGALENEKATSGGVLFPHRYWENHRAKVFFRVQNTLEQLKETLHKYFPD